MKLITKLTLFTTLSKLATVVLFVLLLPVLADNIASHYTNYYLREQKKKVLKAIDSNGIDFYLQGEDSYGSYTMLKDEYISLEPVSPAIIDDTIETAQRLVESDTLTYRILRYAFHRQNRHYLLEVGKTTAAISQYTRPLQKVALYVLIGLTIVTLVADLLYTRLVLRPLKTIIRTKLLDSRFPFKEKLLPVDTSTSDFQYLDHSLIELMGKVKEAFDKEREFTSNASHELMTPIGILQNKIENLLMDNDADEALQQRLAGMMKTLGRLKKIVNALLLISRIDNDQFDRNGSVHLRSLIDDVTTELEDRVQARGLQLTVDVPGNAVVNRLNHDLIFQLFYNLINNAIRYNKEEGAIHVSAAKQANGSWTVAVRDTGIGIAPADLETIFNRFKKHHPGAGEGFGLGLSIVQSIAQYHQLSIDVQSVVGKGSVFFINFP